MTKAVRNTKNKRKKKNAPKFHCKSEAQKRAIRANYAKRAREEKQIIQTLKDIDYKGDFTFECDAFTEKYPVELLPSGLTQIEKMGRYFIKKLTE